MIFSNGISLERLAAVHASYPATQYRGYPAFAAPMISRRQSKPNSNQSINQVKHSRRPRPRVSATLLTSSQTKFLLFKLGRRFIIFSSADLKSPSAVNSMFGLLISVSSETFLRCRKNLEGIQHVIVKYIIWLSYHHMLR